MPIHTPPHLGGAPRMRALREKQGTPEPPDRGSSHFGAWQTAPHQESFERIDKPNLTGVSRCLTDSLLLGYLAAATAVLLPGPLQRGYGVLSDSLGRARQIRPSAKRQTWLPPGPWSTPRFVSTDPQTSHQPNRSCRSFCRSDNLWVEHRPIRPSAKRQTWLPPGPWSTPRVVSTDYQTSLPTKQVL